MATIPEALNAAREHHNAGRINEAVILYARILEQAPKHGGAMYLLGTALVQLGKYAEAIELLNKVIEMAPKHPEARLNLGEAYRLTGQLDEALAHYNYVIDERDDFSDAFMNRGMVWVEQRKFDDAVKDLTKAAELAPDDANLHSLLGYALRNNQQAEASAEHFRKALELDPQCADAAYQFTQSHRFKEHEAYLDNFEHALTNSTLIPSQLASMHFALGKGYDDLKEYGHAFEHYRQGNNIKRKEVTYDRLYQEELATRFMKFFDKSFMDKCRDSGWGSQSKLPIFVIGMPRSGTSMLEQILCSHPDVGAAGEFAYLGDLVNEVPDWFTPRNGLPECFSRVTAEQAKGIGDRYVKALEEQDPGYKHVTEKHTVTFQMIGLIAALLPNAKLLHIQRDPRDTCLSEYFQLFRTGQHFSYDLSDAAHYYGQYYRMMKYWNQQLNVPMLNVQYEDIVGDQEAMTRKILDYCELPWNDKCLAFHKNKRVVHTASVWQVREPLYKRSAGRWKNYEHHIKPLVEGLKAAGVPLLKGVSGDGVKQNNEQATVSSR